MVIAIFNLCTATRLGFRRLLQLAAKQRLAGIGLAPKDETLANFVQIFICDFFNIAMVCWMRWRARSMIYGSNVGLNLYLRQLASFKLLYRFGVSGRIGQHLLALFSPAGHA